MATRTHKMAGQITNLKAKKRKGTSVENVYKKTSASRKKCLTSPKTQSATESTLLASGHSQAAGSCISCECHMSTGRRRCSASPELDGQEGKENKLKMGLDSDSGRVTNIHHKLETEEMDYEESDKHIFPDEDSNQILPVEQFFGNMDAVQDFPQRSPATSADAKRERRRRHYYAREDSDEEESELSRVQPDETEGT